LKKGGEASGTVDIPMESCTDLQLDAIITLNRWQEGRERGQQTTDTI